MIVQMVDMVRDVRVCLDQNMTTDALLSAGDTETLQIDAIIRSKVIDAVRIVEQQAPVGMLENGHSFVDDGANDQGSVHWGDSNSGWVLLPDDFMRLICFEMSDWARPCFEAITPTDALYKQQRSAVVGVRGSWERPVVALSLRAEGRVLEFYSCKSEEATVTRSEYVPLPHVDKDGGVDLCGRCRSGIVYMAASLVASTYGKTEQAEVLRKLSEEAVFGVRSKE